MIRRPPRSTQSRSSAASDVYKRQTSTPSRIFMTLSKESWLDPFLQNPRYGHRMGRKIKRHPFGVSNLHFLSPEFWYLRGLLFATYRYRVLHPVFAEKQSGYLYLFPKKARLFKRKKYVEHLQELLYVRADHYVCPNV